MLKKVIAICIIATFAMVATVPVLATSANPPITSTAKISGTSTPNTVVFDVNSKFIVDLSEDANYVYATYKLKGLVYATSLQMALGVDASKVVPYNPTTGLALATGANTVGCIKDLSLPTAAATFSGNYSTTNNDITAQITMGANDDSLYIAEGETKTFFTAIFKKMSGYTDINNSGLTFAAKVLARTTKIAIGSYTINNWDTTNNANYRTIPSSYFAFTYPVPPITTNPPTTEPPTTQPPTTQPPTTEPPTTQPPTTQPPTTQPPSPYHGTLTGRAVIGIPNVWETDCNDIWYYLRENNLDAAGIAGLTYSITLNGSTVVSSGEGVKSGISIDKIAYKSNQVADVKVFNGAAAGNYVLVASVNGSQISTLPIKLNGRCKILTIDPVAKTGVKVNAQSKKVLTVVKGTDIEINITTSDNTQGSVVVFDNYPQTKLLGPVSIADGKITIPTASLGLGRHLISVFTSNYATAKGSYTINDGYEFYVGITPADQLQITSVKMTKATDTGTALTLEAQAYNGTTPVPTAEYLFKVRDAASRHTDTPYTLIKYYSTSNTATWNYAADSKFVPGHYYDVGIYSRELAVDYWLTAETGYYVQPGPK